jgi:Mor family transcriptional regulator
MANLTPEMRVRRNSLLEGVASVVAEALKDYGIVDDALIEQIGCGVADYLAEGWGGQIISFPMDAAFRRSVRDVKIIDEHDKGTSYPTLVERYKLTRRSLHRLLLRAGLRSPKPNQLDLPLG